MVESPLQQLRKERREFEEFKRDTLQEIQTASLKLDAELNIFGGFREVKSWEASLQHPIDTEDFNRQREFIDAQMAFKRNQLVNGIVEKNEGYKNGLRQNFELRADIKALELQKKVLDVKEKVMDKGEEIRQMLKKHDAEIIGKHLKKEEKKE